MRNQCEHSLGSLIVVIVHRFGEFIEWERFEIFDRLWYQLNWFSI
jgi:hypothetical protein